MPSPEITIFSLDGLHNNGKTTQLSYIDEQLAVRGIPATTRRGDGSRKGLGLSESDPLSPWWQNHYATGMATGLESPDAAHLARLASRQLLAELYGLREHAFPQQLAEEGRDAGVILLDRGPISRWFIARRYEPDISFEAAIGVSDDSRLELVVPDSIVVLHTTQRILLERNEARAEEEKRRALKRQVLTSYYDDFERTLDELPAPIAERTTRIDSSLPMLEVGEMAFATLLNTLESS